MRRAAGIALTAAVAFTAGAATASAAVTAGHAAACRQALQQEITAVRAGYTLYHTDPPACRSYSRAQQRAWLLQDLPATNSR